MAKTLSVATAPKTTTFQMRINGEIKKNVEKRNAKLRKAGIDPDKLMKNASISTKAMSNSSSVSSGTKRYSIIPSTSVPNLYSGIMFFNFLILEHKFLQML